MSPRTSIDSDTSTQTIIMPSISTSTAHTSSAGSLNSSSASSSQTSSPPTSVAASSPTTSFRSFSFTRSPNYNYNSPQLNPSSSSLSSSPNFAADRSHLVRPTLTHYTSCSPSSSIPGSPSRRRSIQHHSPPIVCSSPPANRPSIALSTNEPDFSFKTQPSALTRQKNNQSAPRGKLLVKLISARHLSPPSIQSRPYVVVTFDQNEFVSREPIHEEGEEVTGTARLRTPAEREAELGLQSLQNGGGGPSRSPIPDLKGRLPLPATPGGGLNPGEKGYDDRLAEQEAERLGLNPGSTASTSASSAMLSRSPASGLGRKLEEYSSQNGTPQGSPKPPKPELAPVDVNISAPPPKGDEAKTPTGAADEPQNGFGGEKEMAYNPTWKHEVYL